MSGSDIREAPTPVLGLTTYLEQAQTDLASAYAAWQAALAVFDDLVARVNNAYAKLQAWQAAVDARNEACSSLKARFSSARESRFDFRASIL